MEGRSLFNALRMNWLQNHSIEVEPWQIEEYRNIPTPLLFDRLKELGISLNEAHFLAYAEKVESPEELVEFVALDSFTMEKLDRSYLLLFELWRRFLPNRRVLSLLCDELDFLIFSREQEGLTQEKKDEIEERLQELLFELQDVLDENVEAGMPSREALVAVSHWCAYDLQKVLYFYISELIEVDDVVASELVEGFYEYVEDPLWFDLLKARLILLSDIEHGAAMLMRLSEQIQERWEQNKNRKSRNNQDPQLPASGASHHDLFFELLSVLADLEEEELFCPVAHSALPFIHKEEDRKTFLHIALSYFSYRGWSDKENALRELFKVTPKEAFELGALRALF